MFLLAEEDGMGCISQTNPVASHNMNNDRSTQDQPNAFTRIPLLKGLIERFMQILACIFGRRAGHRGDIVEVSYHIESWLKVGGFRTCFGWIEADPDLLHSLLPAAEVFLTLQDGRAVHIELTEINGKRASIRLPRELPNI